VLICGFRTHFIGGQYRLFFIVLSYTLVCYFVWVRSLSETIRVMEVVIGLIDVNNGSLLFLLSLCFGGRNACLTERGLNNGTSVTFRFWRWRCKTMTILIGSNVANLFFWCPGYGWGGPLKS
jgi:hypothetical protein